MVAVTPTPSGAGSARSLQDAASEVGSRVMGARSGLRDGWDALVKIAFAPCAGQVGGVPADEATGVQASPARTAQSKGGSSKEVPSWAASVPFEVSASQVGASSLLQASTMTVRDSFSQRDGVAGTVDVPTPPRPQMIPEQRALTPAEQRKARQRAKLRQLGARHQLAHGFPGASLAETARPVSSEEAPGAAPAPGSPELVDFDDGISAISSHTLEEMEQRRAAKEKRNVVRIHPLDFTQVIDENAAVEFHDARYATKAPQKEAHEKDAEVVFGSPFYTQDAALRNNVTTVVDASNGVAHDEFVPAVIPPPPPAATTLDRVTSTKTHNTTVTEDSHEMEEMYQRHEAMYWVDDDRVRNGERSAKERRTRPGRGMSVEERARRLRELSRSRSRSDGTGSTNKSNPSSLISGQHPHDTVPVYSSDVFPRRKRSGDKQRRSPAKDTGFVPGSVVESDPFSALDYGEI